MNEQRTRELLVISLGVLEHHSNRELYEFTEQCWKFERMLWETLRDALPADGWEHDKAIINNYLETPNDDKPLLVDYLEGFGMGLCDDLGI